MVDVTVIIPVHNVEQYLERCLDSLIEQDYDKKKMEIFVIDDGSTDRSVDIVKKYEKIYSFITAKYLEENRGVSNARNIGIRDPSNFSVHRFHFVSAAGRYCIPELRTVLPGCSALWGMH